MKYSFGIRLRYNYRLYPTSGQRQALARAFGCARVVFNDGLRAREEAHAAGLPYITDAELSARLTAAKAAGLAVTACGAQVRPEASPVAQRSEAGTHPKSCQDAA